MIVPEYPDLATTQAQEESFLGGFSYPLLPSELTPRKENRQLISPDAQKRSMGFSPYSPRPREQPDQKHIMLSQSPFNRQFQLPVYSSDYRFDDIELPAMYEAQMGVLSPLKRPANPLGTPARSCFKTARRLSYDGCAFEEQPNQSANCKPNLEEPTSYQRSLLSKMEKMRTPETALMTVEPNPIRQLQKSQRSRKAKSRKRCRQVDNEQESNSYREQEGCPLSRAKGLRNLSSSVRNIVYELKKTTYKEVAGRLIERLVQADIITSDNRDEQNVKRRVYDALNVLIAANVLSKEGKCVLASDQLAKHDIARQQRKQIELEQLKLEVEMKQAVLAERQEQARALQTRYQAMEQLRIRNTQNPLVDKSRTVPFPFIIVRTNGGSPAKDSFRWNGGQCLFSKDRVQLSSKNELNPICDTDALLLLYFSGDLEAAVARAEPKRHS